MGYKYAVALLKGDEETILAIFDTKEEADTYGLINRIPHEEGLQYCFAANFYAGIPRGNSVSIYNYYNI